MSNYHARRAPNVSQYLANLNTIPGPQDVAQNDFTVDNDLDFLTNAEFFDFDNFDPLGDFPSQTTIAPAPVQQSVEKPVVQKAGNVSAHGPGYQFGEFQTYPMTASPTSAITSPTSGNLHGAYPPQPPHFPSTDTTNKRKASSAAAVELEDASRYAAEEDKRRRNTAASARFRVKKKQREQALERQAKELGEKVQMLEGKVSQLEMENKWLKELITEKGKDAEKSAAIAGKVKEIEEASERSTEERTDGVGTEAEA